MAGRRPLYHDIVQCVIEKSDGMHRNVKREFSEDTLKFCSSLFIKHKQAYIMIQRELGFPQAHYLYDYIEKNPAVITTPYYTPKHSMKKNSATATTSAAAALSATAASSAATYADSSSESVSDDMLVEEVISETSEDAVYIETVEEDERWLTELASLIDSHLRNSNTTTLPESR